MSRWKRVVTAICLGLAASALGGPAEPVGTTMAAHQQPFICRTFEAGLGQPLVDNHDGIGHPVFDEERKIVGYSRECSVRARLLYFYFNGSAFKPFVPSTDYRDLPPGIRMIDVNGERLPFVVRVEAGTINRFMYTIAMLAPRPAADEHDASAWNRKLVYWLRGGVGIGHQQGIPLWLNGGLGGYELQLMPHLLEQGFAIAASSGNETGVHYNMRLAEQTAVQTKAHFVAQYGAPRYTLGIGGSGGAVQQYLFAQNHPGLIDGGIAVQSYPDMVTQVIPIADCPLLEQYFREEVERDPASPWARWSQRSWIEGMAASDTVPNAWTERPGTTECINGWRYAMPTILNPQFRDPRFDAGAKAYGYPSNVFAKVKWTHWNDLADIYGSNAAGFAPIPIDNVGVQYGLGALAEGKIGVDEFLRLNACVGSWKEQADFVDWDREHDPFDARNMRRSPSCRSPQGEPAPRRVGEQAAMQLAFQSGHVFRGDQLGIPIVDLRPYLEPELNMHNARQSFSVRARLLAHNPRDAAHQVIWFSHARTELLEPVMKAVSVMDRYLVDGSAPAGFADACFDVKGKLLASGASAWDGILDGKPPGTCTRAYPLMSSPRMVAGDSIRGDRFKCALKPVDTALADGSYPAQIAFSAQQQAWLKRIFPQGVCDFRSGASEK